MKCDVFYQVHASHSSCGNLISDQVPAAAAPFTGGQNNAIVFLRFHWIYGGSSKILLLEACLLPLTLVSFFGSLAEAAKSCLRGVSAAFDLGRFHRVFGGGSKILLLRRGCCL